MLPINHERCLNIVCEQGTVEWDNIRKGRITMSSLGRILLFCKTEEEKHKYARIIARLEKEEFTEEALARMKIGVDYEETVRDSYSKHIQQHIYTTGTCIFRENPIFSGSVDGIIENGDIIEIKIIEGDIPSFSCDDYSEIPLWYQYQMLGNMFITDSTMCHYVCYSRRSGKYYVRHFPYDHDRFINECYIPLCRYYKKYVLPVLLESGIRTPNEDYELRK